MRTNEMKLTEEEVDLLTCIRELDKRSRKLLLKLIPHLLQLSLGKRNFKEIKKAYNLPDVERAAVARL